MLAAWIARAMKARKEVLTIMIVIRCRKKWEVMRRDAKEEAVNELEKIDDPYQKGVEEVRPAEEPSPFP
jgi:hypothetical protein